MKVSYNWLQNYFEEKLPEPEKVSEGVIFHSFEVEEMEKVGNDTIFDIKILPDRAHDCLSHFGIAKEISAIFRMKLKEKEYKTFEPEQTNLKIEIKSDKCLRYMGRIVRNIKVDKSPDWLKERLETIGQKSINNIVDAANFVMFDLGQPIHCFDLDKLFPRTVLENSKKDSPLILIRQAREGEKMTTLDNREVKLNPLNMVIADEKNVLALAGIKGGKIAEVTEDTKNIIIEVANFNPTNVRKTSKEVNIFTDAVKRFENDLSPEIVNDAMNDMSALVLEMCKGATLEEVVDVYKKKQEKRKLSFNIKKISKRLGLDVSIATVEDMLKRFGVLYKNTGDDFEIVVPDMRLDLKTEEDMSEEIIRILGYEKLKEKLPEINWNPKMNETYAKISWARNKLLNDGYSEVMTYSFCNKGEIEVLASASDKKFLRTNLTDGLKESLKLNQLNAPLLEMNEIKIFEIGTIFKRGGEEMHIAYGDKKNVTEVSLE
ncbi:MAG: phenylalanine--tRNA ligase subunit beta, partial [Patescibacteria group bacterium]